MDERGARGNGPWRLTAGTCVTLALIKGRRAMKKLLVLSCLVLAGAWCRAAEYEAIDLGTLGEGRTVMDGNRAFLWTAEKGMVDLGTLGGDTSAANAINDAGQVVGWARTAKGERRAFVWEDVNGNGKSDPGEMTDLGTFGGPGSEAHAVNRSGQVVGEAHHSAPGGVMHAFLWTPGDRGGMRCLGLLGGNRSYARAIHDSGQVVGFALNGASQRRAFLWEEARGMLDLGTLGGDMSYAEDINDAGRVVGGAHTAAGDYHAFVWEDVNENGKSDPGGMTDLGTLPGGTESWAYGINDAGQVVGWARTATGEKHAFVWEDVNGNGQSDPEEMKDLGTLPGGTESWAYGINDAGQVVGWARTAAGERRAFLWTPEEGMADLGTLGGSQSLAYAISDAGQVVGETCAAAAENDAVLLTPEEGMGDLGPRRGTYSRAWAISDAGRVVGCARTATGERRAFLWTPEEGMVDLGTLGGAGSEARAINDAGEVVGEAQTATGHWHAFLWTPTDRMLDLGTLAGTDSRAYAINDAGRVVGYDLRRYGVRGFLWTPEEGMLDLAPGPMLGGWYNYAEDMNDAGRVVGGAHTDAGEYHQYHAFTWTPKEGAVDLGTLGGNYSYAEDINDAGQVVGRARTATGEYHAFVWEDANGNGQSDPGEMVDLGTFGGTHSYAYAINETGRVVGEAQTAAGDWHAFLWTPVAGMRDLGTLGGNHSAARAINDSGQVVGCAYNAASQKRAFLWEPATGMIDLGPPDSPGAEAWAINEGGLVTGWALTGAECHAFLWRPANSEKNRR
ncbi:MAG: DUF3466 family protein [Planctomycetota bacterium]